MALAVVRRNDSSVRRTWRIQRRWAMAAAVALFPLLFILDEAVDAAVSPVLPGLAVLLVLLLGAPYALMEWRARRGTLEPVERADMASKYALGAAAVWFLAWLVFG